MVAGALESVVVSFGVCLNVPCLNVTGTDDVADEVGLVGIAC